MGGKPRKKPQVAGTGALTVGVAGTTHPKFGPEEDRSDYFVSDLDAQGVDVEPPEEEE